MSSGADEDIAATRKLTESETATLRGLLKSQLNVSGDAQDEEDAGDLLDYALAMIANGKNVSYVTEELKSMELEVCTAESAQKVGKCLSKFLRDLDNGGGAGGSSQPSKTTPKKETSGKVVNALTNSGALGSSRERKNNNDSGNSNRNDRTAGRKGGTTQQQQRSVHGAAFERLRNPTNNQRNSRTQQQSDNRGRGGSHAPPMNQSRVQTDHERGNNNRRGRDDWGGRGGGRGGRGHGGRNGGRGGGGRENIMSSKRRQRDEDDFVPSAIDHGLQSSRTGDESRDMHSKRARHEQQSNDDNYVQQVDDNWGYNNWQEGRGGGGRFSRGGGRFGRGRGRFSNTFYPNKQNNEQEGGDGEANATSEAAAVSESPLVAGHFSGRGSFRGRGRGRGRFVDGRGRAGRADVAEMISAKTWTRPRTMDEGLSASR